MELQLQSFNEYSGFISFRIDCPRDSQGSSPTPQFKSINSSVLSLLHSPTLTSIHDHRKNQTLTAAAAKSLQSCPTLCDPTDGSPTGSRVPGKNTGVGCHFLLQCMKVKSESEVAQSSPTLCNPMDCSQPGSAVHGIFQARVLEWGANAFSD